MKQSAGILMYRKIKGELEVLLVHPGGPFWKNKDAGSWPIPKGEFNNTEDAFATAIREFEEELGVKPGGDFIQLKQVKQKSGKTVYAWAVEGNFDITKTKSNFFEIEWPPKSGKKVSFPEVDKAGWFNVSDAKQKLVNAQTAFL